MRALLQRVLRASVSIEGRQVASIGHGILIFFAAGKADSQNESSERLNWLASRCLGLRIFDDRAGKMNRSVADAGGEILIVSQFTLYADLKKGFRPSFTQALAPGPAEELYEQFCVECSHLAPGRVQRGVFAADMQVELINDGPVTILIDTER